MATSSSRSTDDGRYVLRQLNMLVIVLIISNIALGAFGFYLLRTIDRNYSALIDQSVPVLNGLQSLTASASETMRTTNPVVLADNKVAPQMAAKAAREAIARDEERRDRVLQRVWIGEAESERVHVGETGAAFDHLAADVTGLLESNNAAELSRRRETDLRPAYNQYVSAVTKAADTLHTKSLKTSGDLSVRTGSLSTLMLSVGTWPMLLLGLLLLFTAIFVIVVLIRVRILGREPA